MRKIKVCHVVSGLKCGGVETMIYNYASVLDASKYEMHLLYQHEATEKNIKEFNEIGFYLKRISSKVRHPILNFIETYRYFKNNKFDVVHCHMTLMNCIPLVAAKKLKIPIRICHSHNSDVRKKNKFILYFEKILKRICIKNSTNLIACGSDAGKYMYEDLPFVILNNALNLNKFKYSINIRKKIRSLHNIKKDEILIGHIGRFTKQKNHEFLINVFVKILKKNPKYKLILLGDGELKKSIEEYVKECDIEEKIIFTGIVDNVNEYYSAFDIFVLPSIWEGFPVVAIEAQASGIPCVLSNNIDNRCIMNSNVSMIELNIEKWCEKIISLNLDGRMFNNELLDKGYDINEERKKLEHIYKGEKNARNC